MIHKYLTGSIARYALLAGVSLFIIIASVGANATHAQNRRGYAIEQAQRAVRDRILNENGGRDANLDFDRNVEDFNVSNNEIGVKGSGILYRNNRRDQRRFVYEARVNTRNGNVDQINYRFRNGGVDGGRDDYDRDRYRDRDRDRDRDRNDDYGDRPNGDVRFSGPIINQNSGKALDVAGRSRSDGANVQQYDYANQDNQKWDVVALRRGEFAIVNRASGKVLDVDDSRINDRGANVQQYRWGGRDNQRWRLEPAGDGIFRIVNVASNKCLDVNEQSRDNSANVHQWDCGGQPSQRWRLDRR